MQMVGFRDSQSLIYLQLKPCLALLSSDEQGRRTVEFVEREQVMLTLSEQLAAVNQAGSMWSFYVSANPLRGGEGSQAAIRIYFLGNGTVKTSCESSSSRGSSLRVLEPSRSVSSQIVLTTGARCQSAQEIFRDTARRRGRLHSSLIHWPDN